jgi:hypothetical protein
MKKLAGPMLVLLRRYPLLWVPQICAALIGLALGYAYEAISRVIWRMLMDSHSVMGGATIPTPPTTSNLVVRSLLEFPLLLLSDFFQTAAWLLALVTVAYLIHRSMNGGSSNLREGVRWTRQRGPGIVNVSLAMIGLFLLKVLIGLGGTQLLTRRTDWQHAPFWHFQAIDWISNLVLAALVIYLLAARILGLASEALSPSLSRREILSARAVLGLAIAGWLVLQYSWSHVLSRMLSSDIRHMDLQEMLYPHSAYSRSWLFAVNLVSPILTAFWLTLLSVALAVIAQQGPGEVLGEDLAT